MSDDKIKRVVLGLFGLAIILLLLGVVLFHSLAYILFGIMMALIYFAMGVHFYYTTIESKRLDNYEGEVKVEAGKYGIDILFKPKFTGWRNIYKLVASDEGFIIVHVDRIALKRVGIEKICEELQKWRDTQ